MDYTELIEKLRNDSRLEISDWDNLPIAANALEALQAEIARLRGEVEALKADAERLDWMLSDESNALESPDDQRQLISEAWERVVDCGGTCTKAQKIEAIDAARSK